MTPREFDVIVFGSTGFVGRLTAEYLAEHARPGLKWAIAGRSAEKLESLRDDLAQLDPSLAELATIEADSLDLPAMRALAERTKVIATTVGPYAKYGEPLVKACADAGTDYLDLCGEPAFVDEMYVKYDAIARVTGARLIHSAGFDSLPHDLGVYYTVLQLPEGAPITVESRVRASGMYSGGTLASAMHAMGQPKRTIDALRARRKVEPRPEGRKIGRTTAPLKLDREMGMWVAPLPTIDQFVVERSAAALERYGPDFKYGHKYAAKRLATVAIGSVAVTGVFVAAQLPPLRRVASKLAPPGTGPSKERRERSWFRIEFVGEGGGKRVRTAISGGDAGYDETAKMLAESAMALALDELPDTAGQGTTVICPGDRLIVPLPEVGIELEVVGAA